MPNGYRTYVVCAALSAAFLAFFQSGAGAENVVVHISESVGLDISLDAVPRKAEAPVIIKVIGTIRGGTRPYTYILKLGDGTVKNGKTRTGAITTRHEYARAGDYTISLWARDARGRIGTTSGDRAESPFRKGVSVSKPGPAAARRSVEAEEEIEDVQYETERYETEQSGVKRFFGNVGAAFRNLGRKIREGRRTREEKEFVEPPEYDEEPYKAVVDPYEYDEGQYETIVEPRAVSREEAYETVIGPSLEELGEPVEEEKQVMRVVPVPEVVPPPWEGSRGRVMDDMYWKWHPRETKKVFVADRTYSESERDIEGGWAIEPRRYRLRPMLVAEEGSWGTRELVPAGRPGMGVPGYRVRPVPIADDMMRESGEYEYGRGDWAVSPGWRRPQFRSEFISVGDEILWKDGTWREYENHLADMPDEKTQSEDVSEPALPADYGFYEESLRMARKETAVRLDELAPAVESAIWSEMLDLKFEHEIPRRIIVQSDWKGVIGKPYWYMIYSVTNQGEMDAALKLGINLKTDKGVYPEVYSPRTLRMIQEKKHRTFLSFHEIPKKLGPGETIEAVAIFGGVSEESTIYNIAVSGLDGAYRIDGEEFDMFHRVLVISYERPGDEFQVDFDIFKYKDTFWVEEEFSEG